MQGLAPDAPIMPGFESTQPPLQMISPRKKLLIVVCLVVPGTLAERRLAAQPSVRECRVELGKTYTLNTRSLVRASCKASGCSSGTVDREEENVPITLTLTTEGDASVSVQVRHAHGAERFTAPVSGILGPGSQEPERWQILEIQERARDQCEDLHIKSVSVTAIDCIL